MSTNQDPLVDAITLGVPTLLQLLDGLTAVLERFNPDQREQLLAILQPEQVKLGKVQQTLKTASFPSHVARFGELLMEAITYADKAIQHIDHSAVDPMRILAASRAVCRAREALFPSATLLAPIHEFFLDPDKRRQYPLSEANRPDFERCRVIHQAHSRETRGGYSAFVPNAARENSRPLIIALHGGTGHGRDTLWHWLTSARSNDMSVMAPTSIDDTWSLFQVELDLHAILENLTELTNTIPEPSAILLAGMSDGATYALQLGLKRPDLFPNVAAFSGMLDPSLLAEPPSPSNNQHIYWLHGHRDTMFPFELANESVAALKTKGLDVVLDEQAGLGHSFASSRVPATLDWFQAAVEGS